MVEDKSKVWNEIEKLQNKRSKYYQNKEDLISAKSYCSKIANGVSLLENEQYNKVKSNCCDAIGEQTNLLLALKFRGTKVNELIEDISSNLSNGIDKLNIKINDLTSQINSLYNKV